MSSNSGVRIAKTSITIQGPSFSNRHANSYKMHTHMGKKCFPPRAIPTTIHVRELKAIHRN